MNLTDNPIRLVYDALWDMLEANSLFVSHVKRKVQFTGTAMHPELDSVSEADLPEVRIILAGNKSHSHNTSDSSRLTLVWQIQVATGEMRFAPLLDVQWIIYCAMHHWDVHVKTLTWNDAEFVKGCYVEEAAETDDNRELNRGSKGWSTVWQGVTDCWFKTSDVEAVGA
jgi:hypothetical protein